MTEGDIIWFYYSSLTCGTEYKVGYQEGNNSSVAIYEEINND